MQYVKLFSVLNNYKIDYLVCGGLAVNIYGIPRMTADIDILLRFTDENLDNFENAVKLLLLQQSIPLSIKTFIKKEDREKAKLEKNLIAYSYYSQQTGFMNLDVLLDVPIDFDILWQQRTSRLIGETTVNLVSIEDLIALKTYANRQQDRNDIILLSKLLNN
jgi:Nucleotidyl transferase AbiEii toxin, Type IV TA system